MQRSLLMALLTVIVIATPVDAAHPATTMADRSPTFTRTSGYRGTSTISHRSFTFGHQRSWVDNYRCGRPAAAALSERSSYLSRPASSAYSRSVLSSGRGLSASRSLYGSSGVRTYTSVP